MGEHQTRGVSKTLEHHNICLTTAEEHISSMSIILKELSHRLAQFKARQ